jgi:hypothetical protein
VDGEEEWAERQSREGGSRSFAPVLEPADTPDAQAPVRACFRYISNHSNFLDYQSALAAGLPMGSGEIASAHRYVFQDRRKVPGGWWKMENLKKMIGLNRCAVCGSAVAAFHR